MEQTPEMIEVAHIKHLLMCEADVSRPLPSFGRLKAFLSAWYLHNKFEGRNGPVWGGDYAGAITRSCLEDLEKRAITCVSRHESRTGFVVWFDRDLQVVNPICANGGGLAASTGEVGR